MAADASATTLVVSGGGNRVSMLRQNSRRGGPYEG